MFSLKLVTVLPLCFMLAACEVITVNLEKNTKDNKCGQTIMLEMETVVTVVANGELPDAECAINFKMTQCTACFMFEKYAFIKSSLVSLNLTMVPYSMIVDADNPFPTKFVCSKIDNMLKLQLMHKLEYVFDPKDPGYKFTLDVYNWCGYRGQTHSVSFEDVVKHAKGYHHGDEKKSRVMSQLVAGLVVGLCLASIFLVVLLLAYCYVKNSPNRGTKSSGMSRGNRGGMDVQSDQGGQPKQNVEMVAYKPKEAERPEGKPLLIGSAATDAQ